MSYGTATDWPAPIPSCMRCEDSGAIILPLSAAQADELADGRYGANAGVVFCECAAGQREQRRWETIWASTPNEW